MIGQNHSNLEELYQFSGASNQKIDVRPQRVNFVTELPWKGAQHPVTIEVVIGCRTTTASGQKSEDKWGIDIYGNDRLFVHHNQDETFKWFDLPTGGGRQLIRGFINIHGPNIFMPWDTHKRHLNVDRDIINILKSKPIKEFFASWKEAYNAIAGMEEIKETIKQKFGTWGGDGKSVKDINVAFSDKVPLSANRRRGVSLPPAVHKPKVSPTKASASKRQVSISFKVTQAEFRSLCSKYEVDTSGVELQDRKLLAEAIKAGALELK